MQSRFVAAINDLEVAKTAVPDDSQAEAVAFMRWLADGQFVFLGMRDYRLDGDVDTGQLQTVDNSGLGVLRDPSVQVLRRGMEMVALTPEVRAFFTEPRALFVTKSNVISRVHRAVHMDYIGIKQYGEDGSLIGELRVVGLFTSKAYTMAPADIPLLRLKAQRVIESSGYVPGSHDGKALINVIDTFPRDELFQIPVDLLSGWAPEIVALETRPRTRLFVRVDPFDRFVSALVFMSRERFSTAVRERIGQHLADRYGGRIVMFQPFFLESRLVRVHFIVGRFEGQIPKQIDPVALEGEIADLTRNWRDRFANAVSTQMRDNDQAGLSTSYCTAFPNSYVETHGIERALLDTAEMTVLSDASPVGVRLYRADDVGAGQINAAIYSAQGPIPLSERVPVFEDMGFRVINEQTYRIEPPAHPIELHDMQLDGATIGSDGYRADDIARIEDCYRAVQSGHAESDAFNALVGVAGAAWREAAMLRAYALYLRQ
ncbi:MAG: NAD-glutamate dehydrogenase, partial [Pseudomonadota bacterium]